MIMPEGGCPECGSDLADVLAYPADSDDEVKLKCADCGEVYWDWLLE